MSSVLWRRQERRHVYDYCKKFMTFKKFEQIVKKNIFGDATHYSFFLVCRKQTSQDKYLDRKLYALAGSVGIVTQRAAISRQDSKINKDSGP